MWKSLGLLFLQILETCSERISNESHDRAELIQRLSESTSSHTGTQREALTQLLATFPVEQVHPQALIQGDTDTMKGVGVAAIVAGVLLGGVGGLLLIGLGAGAMGSFDRRRFFGNNKNPCEAVGQPDTANNDCHERRWDMMKNYFPIHKMEKSLDRAMVMRADAVQGSLEAALNQLMKNSEVIAGPGGDIKNPSSSEGLFSELTLMKDTSSQIARAALASTAILYDSVLNLTDQSAGAVEKLKSNIAAGYSDLTQKVTNASSKQTNWTKVNIGAMVSDSNTALSSAVSAVQTAQTNISARFQTLFSNATDLISNITLKLQRISSKQSDAEDLIHSAEGSLSDVTEQTAQVVSLSIGEGVQKMESAGQTIGQETSSKAQDVVKALSGNTRASIDSAKEDWLDAGSGMSDKAKTIAEESAIRVDELKDQISSILSSGASNISEVITGGQSTISMRTNDVLDANKEVSRTASQLSKDVNNGVIDVFAEKKEVFSSAESSVADTSKGISGLLQSSGVISERSIRSIIQGIGSAQTEAQQEQAAAGAAAQDKIAQSLNRLGTDGSSVAGSISNLQLSIRAGQSKASQDIQHQFAMASGESSSVQSDLTDQLDQVSGSLTDSQSELNRVADTAGKELRGELARGSSETGSQIGQLVAGDAFTKAKLIESILNGSIDFASQADGLRTLLTDLVRAAKAMTSGAGSGKDALDNSVQGASGSLADLVGSLGTSDEETIRKVQAELRSQTEEFGLVGSKFEAEQSSQLGRLWQEISSRIDSEAGLVDQNSGKAESGEKTNLEKGDQLRDSANSIQTKIDSLLADGDFESESAKNGFGDKLKRQEAIDSRMMSELHALLSQSEGEALGSISVFLNSVIESEKSKLSNGVETQRSLLDAMDSESIKAAADSAKLAVLVDEVLKSSNRSKSGVLDTILSVLRSTETDTNGFSERIRDLESQLSIARSESSQALGHLTNSVQSEIRKVPLALANGALGLQNEFELSASDLEHNIVKLKEQLATAESAEEREAAMQGLVVLNKLQGIQQGVREADIATRKQIQEGLVASETDAINVQGAMASVLGVLNTINSEMDSSRVTIDTSTQSIGEQAATLLNGLRSAANSTADRLVRSAAEASIQARFNLNIADARNKVRIAATTKNINDTVNAFAGQSRELMGQSNESGGFIDSLRSTTRDSGMSISGRIQDVLNQVLEKSSQLQSDSSLGANDVLTRLAIVRMAMGKFMSLFNELHVQMNPKLRRMTLADADFLRNIENEIKGKLSGTEGHVNETSAGISELRRQIELSMRAEVEFENYFNNELGVLREGLNRENHARLVRNMNASEALNQFQEFEIAARASQKEEIKKILDSFDERISGSVATIDHLNAEPSLVEKQIREVDRDAEKILTES
jgi:hypothetical protein